MRAVTIELMKKLDSLTIEGLGIPGIELMEKAGENVAAIAEDLLRQIKGKKVAIICGKGNNGGDGWVAGRFLHQKQFTVHFKLLGTKSEIQGDALTNLERAIRLNIPIEELDSLPDLQQYDLIIDALLGTGFTGKPDGLLAELIATINQTGKLVVAVDMPSGVDGDTGEIRGEAIRADTTVTFAYPKMGQLMWPGRRNVGRLVVADIGIPPELIGKEPGPDYRTNDLDELKALLPYRPEDGHKGTFGKGIIIAGSVGYTGAAAMAGESFLRSGAGYAVLGIPQSLNEVMETKLTEVITYPLPEARKKRALSLRSLGEILKLLDDANSLILGPGLSTFHETRDLVRRLVTRVEVPFTLDADALNALASTAEPDAEDTVWSHITSAFVMTPHLGELSRLLNLTVSQIKESLYKDCQKWAQKFGGVLVIKGSPTIILSPDSPIYLNLTGNDGMATAGSGDVLSGLIGGFLAQGLGTLEAARMGVYIHGLAGDIAARDLSKQALIASDIINYIPKAFLLLND
ncbi:NAD(P)H-hydrate dehydratase [bacterium]|nr:NAD(P)H-hydrate dehydratase [bacterium]